MAARRGGAAAASFEIAGKNRPPQDEEFVLLAAFKAPSISYLLQEPFRRNRAAEAGALGELVDPAGDREELRALQIAAFGIGDLVGGGAALGLAADEIGERYAPSRRRGAVAAPAAG